MTKPSKPDAPQAGKADGNMPSKPVQPGPSTAVMVPEAGSEPTVGRASVPVLLIAFLGALVYWGSMYIVEYGGQADARVHYPYTSFKEIQDLQPKGEEEIIKLKGLLVYG